MAPLVPVTFKADLLVALPGRHQIDAPSVECLVAEFASRTSKLLIRLPDSSSSHSRSAP